MNESFVLASALVAGLFLGAVFFGGLWWTVCRSVASQHAGLRCFSSLAVRMSVALGGFYFVGHEHWQRMAACLFGFVIARCLVTWLTRPPVVPLSSRLEQASHAP